MLHSHAFLTPCHLQLGLSEFASLGQRYEPAPVWEDSAAMRLRRDLDRENEPIPGESEVERVLRNLEADVAVADAKVSWAQCVQPHCSQLRLPSHRICCRAPACCAPLPSWTDVGMRGNRGGLEAHGATMRQRDRERGFYIGTVDLRHEWSRIRTAAARARLNQRPVAGAAAV